MFYGTIIFVCLIKFVLATTENGTTEIIFNANIAKTDHDTSITICDHNNYEKEEYTKQLKKYTALEGENIKVIVKHKVFIHDFFCTGDSGTVFTKNVTRTFDGKGKIVIGLFQVGKRMGTIWNCTILTNKNNPTILPVVNYREDNYTATYCHMKIHVRQNKPPQMILVNNMALSARRSTDLSNNDVDFTAEYRYADGDVVDVLCCNMYERAPLTMKYAMADNLNDKFKTAYNLSSYRGVGFVTTLHSGHDNTYMICTNTEKPDYTMFKVIFIMQTEFNVVSIKINGMTMRPLLTYAGSNHYEIDYKYRIISHQYITMVCEVNRTDIKLVVTDTNFVGKVSSYKKKEFQKPTKKAEMSFYLSPSDNDKKLWCSSDFIEEGSEEKVLIRFNQEKNSLFVPFIVHMEMPSNGTVMEFYNQNLKVIFYEYEEGDTLKLNCSIRLKFRNPYLSLKFEGSELSSNYDSAVKTLNLTGKDDNTETSCYLIEREDEIEDIVLYEVRVILRKKVPITTTFTVASTIPQLAESGETLPDAQQPSANPVKDSGSPSLIVGSSVGAVLVILGVVGVACWHRRSRNVQHIELTVIEGENEDTPRGDTTNENGCQTPQITNESENEYDYCHNEGVYSTEAEDHYYTKVDYSRCKQKAGEAQTRNSKVYDEPYVHNR